MSIPADYYETGYRDFWSFYDNQDWTRVKAFEVDPTAVVVERKLFVNPADNLKAKKQLLKYACEHVAETPITYLEFGVREGVSMRCVCESHRHEESTFHGFDTFEGLPEAWVPAWGGRSVGHARDKGEMAASMPLLEDTRVHLFKGLIQDTLPRWLKENEIPGRLFVNIDTDLYTAALFVLTMMHPYMKPGDILHFDELHDELNEFAAFNDYIRSYYVRDRFRLLGRAYDAYLFEFR